MIKQVCFMVMPFGLKPTQVEPGNGVTTIDFDALWDRAYAPMIKDLGFEPVRADQDSNALIITQMIERLYFADLVLADMTIPNGNVYYEIGIRHAAKEEGCVLLAADWSKPLFDVAQMRTIRYPLGDGTIGEAAVRDIRAAIEPKIEALRKGVSPVFQSIKGYPSPDPAAASTMKDVMAAMAAFQGRTRAVRALPIEKRMDAAKALAEEVCQPPIRASAVLAAVRLLKDSAARGDWPWIIDFIGRLTPEMSRLEEIQETNALAVAKAGRPVDAIAKLEALIERSGPTPERLGLLGGRHKELAAATPGEGRGNLTDSIKAYERGMELDLNQYYCSSNLPRLYRQRDRKGDRELAIAVAHVAVMACERARKRNDADEWVRPTLLGAAFDAGDADKAEELAAEVRDDGVARWKVDTTVKDLEVSLRFVENPDAQKRLSVVLGTLKAAVG